MSKFETLAKELIKLHGSDMDSIENDAEFCSVTTISDYIDGTTTYIFADGSKITAGTKAIAM